MAKYNITEKKEHEAKYLKRKRKRLRTVLS